MASGILQTPVALFVFRRPDTTRRVFEAISKARPATLLLIADGPRPDRKGEADACRQVRDIIAQIDWPCEVFKNFSDCNLGCGERMISGLDWVFSRVEEAIILEDDCLPDLSFFPFCQELLERFRGDTRISYISGCNLVERYSTNPDSYFLSRIGGIWGWATWRTEWQRYDRYLCDWPELRKRGLLNEIFDDSKEIKFWTSIFDMMNENRGPDTWDYQWLYTGLKNNSLIIVPNANLIANIGFGPGAVHTLDSDPRFILAARTMQFPLKHPISYVPLRSLDRKRVQDMLPPSLVSRLLRLPRRVIRRLFA